MDELKKTLVEAAAGLSLDEIVAAIDASTAGPSIADPYAFAAWLKLQAG